jgi:pilus assembly protein FimV
VSAPAPFHDSLLNLDAAVPDLPPMAPPAAAPAPEFPMDFDLSAISLDLEAPQAAAPARAAPAAQDALADMDFASEEDDGSDPLARKLELAEEFRQIGDMEGARDLLQEVVAKAAGALKSKAQGMLDDLA